MPNGNTNQPGIPPQPGQQHVPLSDRMITALAESKEGQGLLGDLRAFIGAIICRLKGSCRNRIAEAVQKVGYAGYRRVMPNDPRKWEMFLSNGQHLSWDSTRMDSQKIWFGVSGYWAKLRDVGLDGCCLKSMNSYPPSEAFPFAPDGRPYDGLVRVDADGFLADYDRVGFTEKKLESFRSVRIVAQYGAKDEIPPFPNSQTGVFRGGVVSGMEGVGSGMTALAVLGVILSLIKK